MTRRLYISLLALLLAALLLAAPALAAGGDIPAVGTRVAPAGHALGTPFDVIDAPEPWREAVR